MLDFFGFWLLVLAVAVTYGVTLFHLDVRPTTRVALLAISGAWIGLQVALAATGAFGRDFALDLPVIGIMVAFPLLAAGASALVSPGARRALLGIPLATILALNILRVFGAFFLLLAAAQAMAGPFPFSAGWGDVITGVAAAGLLLVPRLAAAPFAIAAWNVFGALDLLLAVALGTLSFNGYAFQLIHAGPGSDAIQTLPWSLIPTVLVPLYLILHAVVFARLRSGIRAGARARA
ncbi:hypothetical protein [Devosia nitrariae]|uniref:Uncharacterized protein n=1 Tax=Devosia nitrariae TaxID=2071872 RepID=A0ABQ5VYA6_9HYPH|nr:hypothetical protein [Devosia nitrariae]GLQ52787.1 hypothetical protein GCM10010862_00450 [Devosia nitrariae]